MLEKDIERHLRDGVKNMGGWCLKMVCPGFTGMPDRMILLRGGRLAFVELKRPGQRERQRQERQRERRQRHRHLRQRSHRCHCRWPGAGLTERPGAHPKYRPHFPAD